MLYKHSQCNLNKAPTTNAMLPELVYAYSDLSNGDVGDAGGAVGVGAGEGEDFVKLFAKGGGEGAVPYSVDEDEAAAAVLEILP